MIEDQIVRRGVHDATVLDAMNLLRLFVPPELAEKAYEDCALPIAKRQPRLGSQVP